MAFLKEHQGSYQNKPLAPEHKYRFQLHLKKKKSWSSNFI